MCCRNAIKKGVTGRTGCTKTQYSDVLYHPAPLQPKTGDSPCFGESVVCSVLQSMMLYLVVIMAITLTIVGLRASIILDTSKPHYSSGLTDFIIIRGVAGGRKSRRSQTCQLYFLGSCICKYIYCITPLLFLILIMNTLQSDSGGYVSIVEGDIIGHFKKKISY